MTLQKVGQKHIFVHEEGSQSHRVTVLVYPILNFHNAIQMFTILCNLCLQYFKLTNSRSAFTQRSYFRCHALGLHSFVGSDIQYVHIMTRLLVL